MALGRSLLLLGGLLAAACVPGCALFEPWGEFWHQTKRTAKPKGTDQRDTTEESEEQWKVVGDEGRKDQSVELDPDQWWRKYIMSEKARSIEENLGYQ